MIEPKQQLTLGDVRLEYQRINQTGGQGPTLIFLHEGLGCIDMWKHFPRALCQATGRAGLVYSRQGYGGSSPLNGPRSVDFMHREAPVLGKLMDLTGITRATLVGHSDGASIALIYAGSTRDPRLESLVVLAPHLFVEPETLAGIEAAKANYQEQDLKQRLARYHGETVDETFWGWNDIWLAKSFTQWNIEAFVPDITVPTLAIQGLDDQYGTLAQIERLKAGLRRDFHSYLIEGCGHSPHLEAEDQTLQAITSYLSKLPAGQ